MNLINVTVSMFDSHIRIKTFETETSKGIYVDESVEMKYINKSKTQWKTYQFDTMENANNFIEQIKQHKEFSCIVAIRNENEL
jgi:hypothetical protein